MRHIQFLGNNQCAAKFYREVLFTMAGREGNLAYMASDSALSIGVFFRSMPKNGVWKLYKYYDLDKEMALRQIGKLGATLEAVTNSATGYQFYDEYEN